MAINPAIESLRKIISGAKSDLTKLRAINAALTEKVAALRGRSQHYRPEFIEQEVGKLREEARAAVGAYVQRADPFGNFSSPVLADDYWTTSTFLARALTLQDPGLSVNDTATTMRTLLALQRQTNLLLALPRKTTHNLAALAEAAHSKSDWALLGQVYNEAEFRGSGSDETAQSLKFGIDALVIPEVSEGRELAAEAKQLEEKLGYSLRAIRDGADDLGLKMERWQASAAEQRHEQEQGGTAGNDHDVPPAA